MQASDVQAYGTGVLYTYPVGHTITLRECARLLIKESDNTAWKMLDRYLGRNYIRAESHVATQEMSLAAYRILSEPSQTSTTDAPGSREEGS